MNGALRDKTNRPDGSPMLKKKSQTDKEVVVSYLRDVTNRTKDYDLKYDIHKCIEILEGKENQETKDMRSVLEEVLMEKETLLKEKCELLLELDELKSSSGCPSKSSDQGTNSTETSQDSFKNENGRSLNYNGSKCNH